MPSPDLGIVIAFALTLYVIPFGAAIWVYRDATRRPRNARAWAVATFFVGGSLRSSSSSTPSPVAPSVNRWPIPNEPIFEATDWGSGA